MNPSCTVSVATAGETSSKETSKISAYFLRIRTKSIMFCLQRFGITVILLLVLYLHYGKGHDPKYTERYESDEFEYEEYNDGKLLFKGNVKPLVDDPNQEQLSADHPFYAMKEEKDGLHFVSSHPTNPSPSSHHDNWMDDVDRPYFPKGHNRIFSFTAEEKKIEEMKTPLPELLENYKNPCWFEEVPTDYTYNNSFFYKYYTNGLGQLPHVDWLTTFRNMEKRIHHRKKQSRDGKAWRLRCYPYYFVLGFTKAGTTDYCRVLHLFPSVFSGIKKEPQYWNKIRTTLTVLPKDGTSVRPTLADYLDLYDAAAEGIRHKTVPGHGGVFHTGIVGDCDPQTVWQLFNWESMHGNDDSAQPKYKTPHHLYALNPKSKFIVLLRDPVERAFSHFRFFFNGYKSTQSSANPVDDFHKNVKTTISLLGECTRKKTTRECIHDRTLVPKAVHTTVTVGLYSIHLREWLNVFPREQFLFIKSEDYFEKRETAVRQTIDFLGLDLEDKDLSSIEGMSIVNTGKAGTLMRPDTEELLRNFYKPYNEDLINLLQDESITWDY